LIPPLCKILQILVSPGFSPLSTRAQTQSSTFMDLDVGKDLMMPIPSSMEVGDYHPKCNNFVVPLPLSHEYTQDALKQDLRNLAKLPLECEHLDFQVRSPEEDECIKSPTGKALDTRHSIQY
jgi:hypothetical protein